jgi:hypothetical protein
MDIQRAKNDLAQAERDLVELNRQIAELQKARADTSERIDQIKTFLLIAARYGGSEVLAAQDAKPPVAASGTTQSAREKSRDLFYGKSLPQAVCALLLTQGRPMNIKEITGGLIQFGVVFGSRQPETSVHYSLRRAEKLGHVVRIGRADWGISKESIASGAVLTFIGADSATDYSKHSEITKEGVDVARSRGVRIGRPVVMTEDTKNKLMTYILEEGLSIPAAAAKVGVSKAAVYAAFPGGVKGLLEKYPRPEEGNTESLQRSAEGSIVPFKKAR